MGCKESNKQRKQTRRKNPLVHKGLNYLEDTLWGLQVGNIVLQFCENVKNKETFDAKSVELISAFTEKNYTK